MATHPDEHSHELLADLTGISTRVVVDDVLLGDECGQIVEQHRLRILHQQVVSMGVVEEDDPALCVEAASPIPRLRVGQDSRESTVPGSTLRAVLALASGGTGSVGGGSSCVRSGWS